MRENNFVNLHVHTEYSLLESSCRIKQLIERVKELGQTAVAITDCGNMYGVIEFYNTALESGIKPIIGCEVYVAPHSRFDRDFVQDSRPYHLVLLCRNKEGYRNLIKLVSLGNLEGFYEKPRIDKELLRKYHSGLICLSGCTYGEVARLIFDGDYISAKKCAVEYRDIFGEDSYYIEVQNHGMRDELEILPYLYKLSEETGIPLVATNDCHYVNKSDAEIQNILLCIKNNKTLDEPNVMRYEKNEFYVKSADEMFSLFTRHSDAVENTVKIADECINDFNFESEIKLPEVKIDGAGDNRQFFRELCRNGMYERYGENPPEKVSERLEYEMQTIENMGYVNYYLIVWDFIQYARKNDIPVGPGRGSGTGSLCAYCIGITGIDPVEYNLLFERFLNPERVSMPDFDIDFCVEGRHKVKEYVVDKYGKDKVSEIIAFDKLKSRAAVRDVGRVLKIPNQLCDKTAKLIETGQSLNDALAESKELMSLYNTDKSVHKLIDTAIKVEGMPRHILKHAAGVVISSESIGDIVPMQRNDETVVTQYTAPVLESMGLLKIDFLGLRNLTVIKDCVDEIRLTERDFDIENISFDDKEVYDMLSAGDTTGVFQMESDGMRQWLTELKPRNIKDLIAMLSLYRPGPMDSISDYIRNRQNPSLIKYKHPMLEDILSETYGCMVYQEQIMEICRKLAGYSYGHADVVRKAMSKKNHEALIMERDSFVEGAAANGISSVTANEIFDSMISFASYGFNKSHAAAYSHLAYQTAYLKCHYKGIYMAALMSSVVTEFSKLAEYMSQCRNDGIEITPPDVNTSSKNFIYRDGKITFGLLAIKNMGELTAERIVSEREENGKYISLQNFCERMKGRELNRRVVESLIKSGAFDGLGLNRRQMLENYEHIMSSVADSSRGVLEGQLNLLGNDCGTGMDMVIPPCQEYPMKQLLRMEKEAAGIYFSGNPISDYNILRSIMHLTGIGDIISLTEQGKLNDGDEVSFLCVLDEKRIYNTKKGGKMCFILCSDESGEIDAVVFTGLFEVCGSRLTEDSIFVINGKISVRDEKVSIICGSIFEESEFDRMTENMRLCIKTTSDSTELPQEFIKLCGEFPGNTEICFYLTNLRKTVRPRKKLSLKICGDSCLKLSKIFSDDKIGLIRIK